MTSARKWPIVLAVLFVVLLGWYLFYTQQIVQALRTDAANFTRIYQKVQEGLADPSEGGSTRALAELQRLIIDAGVPLVLTGPGDTVLAVANLPFEADLSTVEGRRRVREYLRIIDLTHPPVGDPDVQHVHYGDPPEVLRLRLIPWFQAGGLFLTVLVGFALIRYQRRVEGERAWTAMARELAHQLGTPISSLQGWLEVLSLPPGTRPGAVEESEIVREMEEDLVRLEGISRRFELIGREPELASLRIEAVLQDLERYLNTRLPRLGPGVALDMDVPEGLPPVQGHAVLLTWALENVVKNSLDALAGRGGAITIECSIAEPGWVAIVIRDTGPGVDLSIRDRMFEPGVSTKSGGWGVGLALARRIVEGVHGGRIELVEGAEEGTAVRVKLPEAEAQ